MRNILRRTHGLVLMCPTDIVNLRNILYMYHVNVYLSQEHRSSKYSPNSRSEYCLYLPKSTRSSTMSRPGITIPCLTSEIKKQKHKGAVEQDLILIQAKLIKTLLLAFDSFFATTLVLVCWEIYTGLIIVQYSEWTLLPWTRSLAMCTHASEDSENMLR